MKYWLLTCLSSIGIVLSFAPWGFWPLIFVALVPWLWVLQQRPDLKFGWLLGFLMSVFGFPWVATSIQSHGELPWILAIPMWLVFCAFNQFQFVLFTWAFRQFKCTSTLTVAWTYTLIDQVFPKLFQDTLGHALIGSELLSQNAAFLGVSPLTTWVVACNHALLKPSRMIWVGCSVVLFMGSGLFLKRPVEKALKDSPTIKATVIQANISHIKKAAAQRGIRSAMSEAFGRYEVMTQARGDDGSAFYVWPESAFPGLYDPTETMGLHDKLSTLVQSIEKPLLFGAVSYTDGHLQNGLHLRTKQGQKWSYFKSVLLPFAEFVPFSDFFPFILDRFPQIGNFRPGNGPEVQLLPTEPRAYTIHPNICYEILIPEFLRRARALEPDFVVNITNDGWFGTLGEAELHLDLARFRAIETRLSILRATNTGISTLIDPLGRLIDPSETFQIQTPQFNVPVVQLPPTVVQIWGHKAWMLMCLSLLIIFNLLALRHQKTDP
jgi:apolipoprotein N-acyltransferase